MVSKSPSWTFYWFLGILFLILIGGLTIDLFFVRLYGQWLFVVTTVWLYLVGDAIGATIGFFLKPLGSRYGMLIRFIVLTGAIVAGANASYYFEDGIVNFLASLAPLLRFPAVAVLSFFGPMLLFVDLYVHSEEYKDQRKRLQTRMNVITRYGYPILIAVIIAAFFFILPLVTPSLSSDSGVFNSIGGLLFAADIAYFWNIFQAPVLAIDGIERVRFSLSAPPLSSYQPSWEYSANRIIVRNVGRSAARNCKGWILMGERKERVAWTVRDSPNITINQKDTERLDFCAYYVSGQRTVTMGSETKNAPWIIRSTENGWSNSPWNDQIFEESPMEPVKVRVLITADNANPVEKPVYFAQVELTF